MQAADQGQGPQLHGQGLRIGIVQARFNANVTQALAYACTQELSRLGVEQITRV